MFQWLRRSPAVHAEPRVTLLADFAANLTHQAAQGVFGAPMLIPPGGIQPVIGPRSGVLHVSIGPETAGLDFGKVWKALHANDGALLRQLIPWPFPGVPNVGFVGRTLRLEAGWPDDLAERNIPLSSLGHYPDADARWIVGKTDDGGTVTMGFDALPHILMAGQTGSGKSVALQSAVAQLSTQSVGLVLIDCKWGVSLRPLAHAAGVVGPLCADVDAARRALAWVVEEMRYRYAHNVTDPTCLVVVIDEVQELTGRDGDNLATELLSELVRQGRQANIHCLVCTQHPTLAAAFTDPTIRRNIAGRVALRVEDAKASEVAVGGHYPRADQLLGAGDAYCIGPGMAHRTQVAYIPPADLAHYNVTAPYYVAQWPELDAESLGSRAPETPTNVNGAVKWSYTGGELATALIHLATAQHTGRPTLMRALQRAGYSAGSDKAGRLLELVRECQISMAAQGWQVCLANQAPPDLPKTDPIKQSGVPHD